MDNEIIITNLKNSYDSLKYFIIKNNILYFKDNDKLYSLPLQIVNISNLNPNMFLLKPRDIYRIIFLLEVLNKKELSEYDSEFIKQYTNKYLKLENERLDNNDVDENEIMCLGIPIYTSYDPMFVNNPGSVLIQNLLNARAEQIENGKSHGQKLVLANPNFPKTEEEEPNAWIDLGKAGFTATSIIILTIILTSIYIAFFILKK